MNTEINLLEKQSNKITAPVKFVIIFVLLITAAVILLFVQHNRYTSQIESQQNQLSQLESFIAEHQNESAKDQELKEVEQAMTALQLDNTPDVALYKKILGLLRSPNKLVAYDFTSEEQIVVEASFDSLDKVADYTAGLLDQAFISDTELTGISRIESRYQATLTITIDDESVMKELGGNA